jgi:hypothetical protein
VIGWPQSNPFPPGADSATFDSLVIPRAELARRLTLRQRGRVPTLWDPAARRALADRAGRLAPDARPRWGRFTAPEMVAHLVQSLKMASGEVPTGPKGPRALRRFPLKQLVVYVLPVPKGVRTAPELLARAPQSWNGEVEEFRAMLERFALKSRGDAWPDHPAFGAMSARGWGVLTWKHLDHHLRQFGV